MSSGKNVHVVRHSGGWAPRREGADRVSAVYPTQGEAIKRGEGLARASKGELVIHGRDGRIRDSDSYGNDPNPPRDRKH